MPRRLALLTTLICLGAAVTATGATAATPARGFFGISGWSYPSAAQIDTLSPAGLGLVRGAIDWNEVEPRTGERNWASLDALMASASTHHFDVLGVLNGCAVWACGAVRRPPLTEPAAGQYRDFVRALVTRYGAGGSFWASRGIAQPPRVMWQVWNEVNGGFFWPNPTPADYAPFLASIGSTIKAVDPGATIVTSGLVEKPGEPGGAFMVPFLNGLYAQPGYRASFDAQGVHGYAESPAGSLRVLDHARRVMLEHGDGDHPLWVTEMSWATGGPEHPFKVSDATQAQYLQTSWDAMYACRQRWNLQHVLWFALQDVDAASMGEPDYWGFNNGLFRRDGSAKPALGSFLQYLGAGALPDGRGEACGLPNGLALDIVDPDTIVTTLPGVVRGGATGTVSFTSDDAATDRGTHFECALDGADWQPCTSPFTVTSEREGQHEIRVRAIDTQGNVDATPATGSWTVDRSPPNTTLVRRTPAATSNRQLLVAFAAKDAVGVDHVECRYDATAWKRCTTPYRTPTLRSGNATTLKTGVAHSVSVRAVDTSGQIDPTPLVLNFKINCRYPKYNDAGKRTALRTCPKPKPKPKKKVVKKRPVVKKKAATTKPRAIRKPKPTR